MAKPALGRGLGELLNGHGASGTRAATETRTAAAPHLSAGMSTLVRSPGDIASPAVRPPSLTVLRVSLLAADLTLTGGAVFHFLSRSTVDGMTTVAAMLSVLFGGWLGWLGLTWSREERG